MKEVAISEFKAKCLAMIEEVEKTKQPIRVTKFGRPLAEVVPATPDKKQRSWIGSMKGQVKFLGDIVAPVFDESDWKDSDD
jgi:prevent-host-death family protein